MRQYSPQESAELLYQLSLDFLEVCKRKGITDWPYSKTQLQELRNAAIADNADYHYEDQIQAQADALCQRGIDCETIYEEILSIHLERLASYIPEGRISPVPYAILAGRKQRRRRFEPKPFGFVTLHSYYLDMLELEEEALLPASERRPAPKTYIKKSASILLVALPPELSEYESSLRKYPEYQISACDTEDAAFERIKQSPPDGGIYYADSLQSAVRFLRKVSDTLNVPLMKNPRFLILMDNPSGEDKNCVAEMYGYPWSVRTAASSPDAVAWFLCHKFFDMTDGCYNELAPINDGDRGAALLYRMAFVGREPAADSKDVFLEAALLALSLKERYAIWKNAVKAAVAEVGMTWKNFWFLCYPCLAETEDYTDYIEDICEQMELGFAITDWTMREKADPCSEEMQALFERVRASKNEVGV